MKNGEAVSLAVFGSDDGITEDNYLVEVNNINLWNIDIANVLYKGNIVRLQEAYEK